MNVFQDDLSKVSASYISLGRRCPGRTRGWLRVLLEPGVGRGGILMGSGGSCFLHTDKQGEAGVWRGRRALTRFVSSLPAQRFPRAVPRTSF